jgi:hypothetical protein
VLDRVHPETIDIGLANPVAVGFDKNIDEF